MREYVEKGGERGCICQAGANGRGGCSVVVTWE